MSTCTFFGHRDTSSSIKEALKQCIIDLIDGGVDNFLVGSKGNFDRLVQAVLRELTTENYEFAYSVVLAYLPSSNTNTEHTVMYPNFENVPKRYAIDRRNSYMLKQANIVVGYVLGPTGGAYKFFNKAIRQGKQVINIAEKNNAL